MLVPIEHLNWRSSTTTTILWPLAVHAQTLPDPITGVEIPCTESLLQAHAAAIEHFGGVTREILYDRMRTVLKGESTEGKRWNRTFAQFAKHWGFEPWVCRPYRAQTKGKAESGVKYVKRNFLPGRVLRDLAGLDCVYARLPADLHYHVPIKAAAFLHYLLTASPIDPRSAVPRPSGHLTNQRRRS